MIWVLFIQLTFGGWAVLPMIDSPEWNTKDRCEIIAKVATERHTDMVKRFICARVDKEDAKKFTEPDPLPLSDPPPPRP
jgi:hypothetical protein